MEVRREDLSGLLKEHRRIIAGLSVLILFGLAAAVVMCLTKEETGRSISGEVQAEPCRGLASEAAGRMLLEENVGASVMETNPLTEATEEGVARAVEEYYGTLAGHADFVEAYHNLRVYTKLGKYKGTYIAFVRYDMKIRDIYTLVPGLGTLYLEQDEEQNFQVEAKTGDEEIKAYVQALVSHEDVKALMSQIQADYANAAASDAMLAEALEDLKNAYENQTKR